MLPAMFHYELSASPYNPTRLDNQNFGMGISSEPEHHGGTHEGFRGGGYHFHKPHLHWPFHLRRGSSKEEEQHSEGPAAEQPIKLHQDDETYQLSMDVGHFMPNEVSIRTTEDKLIIEGNHDERSDGHGLVSRSFTRKYILPKWVDPKTLTADLDNAGILHMRARKHRESAVGQPLSEIW